MLVGVAPRQRDRSVDRYPSHQMRRPSAIKSRTVTPEGSFRPRPNCLISAMTCLDSFRARPSGRDQHRHGCAMSGDGDAFTLFDPVEQRGKVGLGFI